MRNENEKSKNKYKKEAKKWIDNFKRGIILISDDDLDSLSFVNDIDIFELSNIIANLLKRYPETEDLIRTYLNEKHKKDSDNE